MEELIQKTEMVVTIDGTTHPRTECRKMGGEYYLKGNVKKENSGQCYYINTKYYKYNTGYIVFDHSIQEYVVKNISNLAFGIITYNEDGSYEQGYYSCVDNQINITTKDGNINCMSADLLPKNTFIQDSTTGKFIDRLAFNVRHLLIPAPIDRNIKNGLPYDSRGGMDNLISSHAKYNPVINDTVKTYAPVLKDLTFGVEFETVNGAVPEFKCKELGLMALRDGSIAGLEYATIPLQGEKGLQTLVNTITELRNYTTYDKDCSIHFHIGNMPRTEEFLLALFKVLCAIQDPMYAIFPLYKKYNFGVKRKHYTQAFPFNETIFQMDKVIDKSNIKANFDILYKFLSMGQSYKNVGNSLAAIEGHPSDPRGTSKWNIRTRYYWVNLIPILFGNKETIEFRLHTPTYDSAKIINYLLLCTTIINYVKANTESILRNPDVLVGLNIPNLLYSIEGRNNKDSINRLVESLISYFSLRRDHIYNENKRGNIVGDEDSFVVRRAMVWEDKDPKYNIQLTPVKLPHPRAYNPFHSRQALDRAMRFGNMEVDILREV